MSTADHEPSGPLHLDRQPAELPVQELMALLVAGDGRLGQVAVLYAEGVRSPSTVAEAGAAANSGAASTLLNQVRTVLNDGYYPTTSGVARTTAAVVRGLLARATDASPEARDHLAGLLRRLDETAGSYEAAVSETEALVESSEELETQLLTATGVYVYTYPHYWRYPVTPKSEARMLKIGMTTREAWRRVQDQARATGAPEDPLLLRVYVTPSERAAEVEKVFHRLLDAARHDRSQARTGGREWFETHLEFLDEVAALLDLPVLTGVNPR